jgi:uncharacterized membrane protein
MRIPPYEAMHPLVVHFPIAFLLTVWIPALVACVMRKNASKHWWIATLTWYAIGVTGAMLAISTGDAALGIVGSTSEEIAHLLDVHKVRAEQSKSVFILSYLLTLSGVLIRFVNPEKPWKPRRVVVIVLGALGVVTYLIAARLLLLAAHAGGELVHVHGVHAPLGVPMGG